MVTDLLAQLKAIDPDATYHISVTFGTFKLGEDTVRYDIYKGGSLLISTHSFIELHQFVYNLANSTPDAIKEAQNIISNILTGEL